jgi:hypothetical protein
MLNGQVRFLPLSTRGPSACQSRKMLRRGSVGNGVVGCGRREATTVPEASVQDAPRCDDPEIFDGVSTHRH